MIVVNNLRIVGARVGVPLCFVDTNHYHQSAKKLKEFLEKPEMYRKEFSNFKLVSSAKNNFCIT